MTTVNEVLDQMVEDSIDPRFHDKVSRMKQRMSEQELARWLFDRGALPDDLKKKYKLDRVMSNVSSVSEIPEEAPPEQGDVNTAGQFGLDTPPPSPDAMDDDGLEDLEEDGDELTAESPKEVLQTEAENRGLSKSGTRQEIFDRIVAFDNDESRTDEG